MVCSELGQVNGKRDTRESAAGELAGEYFPVTSGPIEKDSALLSRITRPDPSTAI